MAVLEFCQYTPLSKVCTLEATYYAFDSRVDGLLYLLHFGITRCLIVALFIAPEYFRNKPGSSVSIVSGYGLDDRAIEVRSPAEAKGFASSLCVQTGSGAHPASCTVGTRGPFPGG
jgi:hypothetical protein